MGRRYGMIEHTKEGFTIRYPQEKHNQFKAVQHTHCSNACEDLIMSLIIFAYDGDKINIYADLKLWASLDIYIQKNRDLIKAKDINLKLKDIGDSQ